MRAMILAAGLGKRMRPLTDKVPKPLLKVGGEYLISYHLKQLAKAGIKHVVINTHWLADQLPKALGDGSRWGLSIEYSFEPELLETAGGIINVLSFLEQDGDDSFLLVNGDVYTELDLAEWLHGAPDSTSQNLAYLALAANPDHHPEGDFLLSEKDMVGQTKQLLLPTEGNNSPSYTYSGIGLYHLDFFKSESSGPSLLGALIKKQSTLGKVSAAFMSDFWLDVGTPERLQSLQNRLSTKS